LVPPVANEEDQASTASLHSLLGAIRTCFEFSIVAGPCAAESTAVIAMAQQADGIVLVMSAQRTRRIAARKIKEKLEAARAHLLGVVLSDRVFPIPERIYRRL
jgi:Mrp family chromosome partitioning ATPase